MDFTDLAGARKRCRNPKCRSKLPKPVANKREAFCTRGCHSSFYRKRCVVCEGPIERKNERRLICGKLKCRSALQTRKGLGRYLSPSATLNAPEKPIKSGLKSAHETGRPPAFWRVVAAGAPISANAYHCATIDADRAVADVDRINANHWRAAKAGERGYRRCARKRKPITPVSPATSPGTTAIFPVDLSIPDFLRRST